MLNDERTFATVRGVPKVVRRPSSALRYNPKYTVKTMKDHGSVMVWRAFSGNVGRAGLYFLIKKCNNKRKYLYQHFKRSPLHILKDLSM